jgi:hypothetical protein
MAIAPNTPPFVAGSILTATQMTALPMGIVALSTTNLVANVNATETVAMQTPSFTAYANRYYRISFNFAGTLVATTGNALAAKIRLTNAAGTVYGHSGVGYNATGNFTGLTVIAITTLAAGATVICGTVVSSAGSGAVLGGVPYSLIVEDVGPA